jgi:hypothetical protein
LLQKRAQRIQGDLDRQHARAEGLQERLLPYEIRNEDSDYSVHRDNEQLRAKITEYFFKFRDQQKHLEQMNQVHQRLKEDLNLVTQKHQSRESSFNIQKSQDNASSPSPKSE